MPGEGGRRKWGDCRRRGLRSLFFTFHALALALPVTTQPYSYPLPAFELYDPTPSNVAGYSRFPLPPKGIICSGYDEYARSMFRIVQAQISKQGIQTTFNSWDGIDGSIKNQRLEWKEMRIGLSRLILYDPFGQEVMLSAYDIEKLVREFSDSDSSEFRASQWGSSYYPTDGSNVGDLTNFYEGRPKNLLDGSLGEALCYDVGGVDLGICGFADYNKFSETVNQKADLKYSQICNGHGICDLSVGFCHCDHGWTGFNCSEPDVPCSGVRKLQTNYGSFSDGFGKDRTYANNLNCTWTVIPEHNDMYGLPLVFVFIFFNLEQGFDEVSLYASPYVSMSEKIAAFGVGGTFPQSVYAMPQSIVPAIDTGATVSFQTDDRNLPVGMPYLGFKVVYGCERFYKPPTPKSMCVDSICTNCGVTFDQKADFATNDGVLENMCFSSFQSSNTTTYNISQGYYPCSEVLDTMFLQYPAGSTVKIVSDCPRGFMPLNESFQYGSPEYIIGPGYPQVKTDVPSEGQAYQRGYIIGSNGGSPEWWSRCDQTCNTYRLENSFNKVYQDQLGYPGPILAAQIVARNTSVASQILGPWVTTPPSPVTGLQYGYPYPPGQDIRNRQEKNSYALREKFDANFYRCTTASNPPCPLGEEKCILYFKPTIPGFYDINFYNLQIRQGVDTYMRAVPFPNGYNTRTAIIIPDRTSPGHSIAHGPGLAYSSTTRAGITAYFHIDSYDVYNNPRLSGGDQYIVALVHTSSDAYFLASIMNSGNGSYIAQYTVTMSGRYSVYVGIKDTGLGCPNSQEIRLQSGSSLFGGQKYCNVGVERTDYFAASIGVAWCPTANSTCVSYSPSTPNGLSPNHPCSPFSVWVDSGPTRTDLIQAFGTGLRTAVAGYRAFFSIRIKDIYGNWATQREQLRINFEEPLVSQTAARNGTSPNSAKFEFAGDDNWTGDYLVEWDPLIAGVHKISILLCDPQCNDIQYSPFVTHVSPGPAYAPNSTIESHGQAVGTAGISNSLLIFARDSSLNQVKSNQVEFEVHLSGVALADCPLVQEQVLVDISCACPSLNEASMLPCNKPTEQNMPEAVLSPNLSPQLICSYLKNEVPCTPGCCPNGSSTGCSAYSPPPWYGKAANESACPVRKCASPHQCQINMKAAQQHVSSRTGTALQTFVDDVVNPNGVRQCLPLERMGLENGMVMPPDVLGNGYYGLDVANIDPARPSWMGPMSDTEIRTWISGHNISQLYYTQALNAVGKPYFVSYDSATGSRQQVEGFVSEFLTTTGRRWSESSSSISPAPENAAMTNMVSDLQYKNYDNGTWYVSYKITRAGLYNLAISYEGLLLRSSPIPFRIEPGLFDATNSIVNGTGVSEDKNVYTLSSDYQGAIVSGKYVYFDIFLRDSYLNYLWKSELESNFFIHFDPMRIRYFDTLKLEELEILWQVNFQTYSFHDYGDAHYTIDYKLTTSGNYPFNVRLLSSAGYFVDLDKSPYMIVVRPDVVDIGASTAYGNGLAACGAGLVCTFAVETRDRWGNRRVLEGDEGPYCHTWNPNVNNGGSGAQTKWQVVFPSAGCKAGNDCLSTWTQWANSQPASQALVGGGIIKYPAFSNQVAYSARGGLLHDCVPLPPFSDPAEYNRQASCKTSRLGPCGQYDEWGRINEAVWKGPDGVMYTWNNYRNLFPDLVPFYTAIIPQAQPSSFQNFKLYVDANNMYSGSYNITRAGTYLFSLVFTHQNGTLQHINGSPFSLSIAGGLTEVFKSTVVGSGLHSAVIGYPSTFTVIARDKFGNQRSSGREKVEVFIQNTNFGSGENSTLVVDRLDGTYFVAYNITVSGTYLMSVSMLDKDLPGSPFRITVGKGFDFPMFNTTFGFNLVGTSSFRNLQGRLVCWEGHVGCVNSIQLCSNTFNSVGAVWYNVMQRVNLGFETQFSFRIKDPVRNCSSSQQNAGRCVSRGGDGFAFVIHDNGTPFALGGNGSNLGYGGIDNAVAFELDTWYNANLGDIYLNHLSVHTMGTEQNEPSLRSRIAHTTALPNLADGHVHTMRIRYEFWIRSELVQDPSYSPTARAVQILNRRPGTIRIWMDDLDRPILSFPFNVEEVLSLVSGHAWIGFTASTGSVSQVHEILSWSFQDSTCVNDCNMRGRCIDGECHCEPSFSGLDCSLVNVPSKSSNLSVCPIAPGGWQDVNLANCSCQLGFYGPRGGPCRSCPANSYQDELGMEACKPCPLNSKTLEAVAARSRQECICQAGYVGPDGGPCQAVPEDSFKIAPGSQANLTGRCPAGSGTMFLKARTSILECRCKPGYSGPDGGPCTICPSNSWKSSWGSASCDSTCPPNSETFGCAGTGGNIACVSFWQCVCQAGYYGNPCAPGSPQATAGKTCPPCVRSQYGPMQDSILHSRQYSESYKASRGKTFTIPNADHRENPE
eukprot:768681-Hanusia_phi.AAC.10